jgi:hypothetical protein
MFGHHTGKWFRALSDEMPQNSLLLLLLKAMEKTKEHACRIWNGFSSFYFNSNFKFSLFFDKALKQLPPLTA